MFVAIFPLGLLSLIAARVGRRQVFVAIFPLGLLSLIAARVRLRLSEHIGW